MKQFLLLLFIFSISITQAQTWNSKWISTEDSGALIYHPDKDGDIIPDFSKVGYLEGQAPPVIEATITLKPVSGDNKNQIQAAINTLASRPLNADGFRGCIVLSKGVFKVSDEITIAASGIVIRGSGTSEQETVILATNKKKHNLFNFLGEGSLKEQKHTRQNINMTYVPVGTKKLTVKNASVFKKGDQIVVYRPGTNNWVSDIDMDKIPPRTDGKPVSQWKSSYYNLEFERKIESINGDTLIIDNPIVMEMDDKYGGGSVYKYEFEGRITNCGIENILLKSEYEHNEDEEHAWSAITFEKARDCWVKDVVAKHFIFSAVDITETARNISVLNVQCLEAKSKITGGRRYSFNCNGQLNLFKNCETTESRHAFITGSKVCGPNVFTQSKATNSYNDIGPHERWAAGTLFDCIESDSEIKVQDRGNYGSGHGWAGVTQVVWNCSASEICVQNPWVAGKNYAIGCHGEKDNGRFPNRPNGEWEGLNKPNLEPHSLYEAQLAHQKL